MTTSQSASLVAHWRYGVMVFCAALALCAPLAGWANCSLSGPLTSGAGTDDSSAARIPFGRINTPEITLQPAGTLLAATIVPPTNFTHNGAQADSILWTCDLADLPNLYFLVSTNGDDRVGGSLDVSTKEDPGLVGVYATWFAKVGIKLIMEGVVLSRWYQKVPLNNYDVVGSKIVIRLRHVPVLRAELYRIRTIPTNGKYTGFGSDFCWAVGTNGVGRPTPAGTNYSCDQPNAYIQLHGPGLQHDEIGEDHNTKYAFWWGDNGFGYRMTNAATLSETASCAVRNNTPVVTFPTVSVQQLMQGMQLVQNFSVQIACSNQAQSGLGSGQTAIGIQVSPGAWQAAQTLGLINSAGGVTHLVADDYNAPSTARGVGVTVQNPAMAAGNLLFVGADLGGNQGGNTAGWYPALAGATAMGAVPGGTGYLHTFTATLARLNAQTVTPGNFQANATIVLKIQ